MLLFASGDVEFCLLDEGMPSVRLLVAGSVMPCEERELLRSGSATHSPMLSCAVSKSSSQRC